jgi:hypothetical protein
MQLSAAQTSLEPQPHRVDRAGPQAVREPNITEDDGSRFASEPDPVQRPRVAAHGLPSQSQTSCRLCADAQRWSIGDMRATSTSPTRGTTSSSVGSSRAHSGNEREP